MFYSPYTNHTKDIFDPIAYVGHPALEKGSNSLTFLDYSKQSLAATLLHPFIVIKIYFFFRK